MYRFHCCQLRTTDAAKKGRARTGPEVASGRRHGGCNALTQGGKSQGMLVGSNSTWPTFFFPEKKPESFREKKRVSEIWCEHCAHICGDHRYGIVFLIGMVDHEICLSVHRTPGGNFLAPPYHLEVSNAASYGIDTRHSRMTCLSQYHRPVNTSYNRCHLVYSGCNLKMSIRSDAY